MTTAPERPAGLDGTVRLRTLETRAEPEAAPAKRTVRQWVEAKRAALAVDPDRPVRPGPRGWSGRGGGRAELIDAPDEWRGTTVQVCGLWPFSAGSGSPMTGVPLGQNTQTGDTVCGDPISWFQRGALISNPSMFLLGLPGLGKSTLIRRMALGLTGFGVIPLILADLKPDYVDLIQALGGQVITVGRGRGGINVLDPGESAEIAARLTGSRRKEVEADAQSRRVEMVKALLTIVRKQPIRVQESNILGRAIQMVSDRADEGAPPVLPDLLQLIKDAPDDLRLVAIDRGDINRYQDATVDLESGLLAMMRPEGPVSDIFSKPTTVQLRRDRPAVYDVHSIRDGERDLQAAALLACWSNGFASVNNSQILADAGLEPRRNYFIVLDELWRALRSGPEMVDRVDGLTRLNRSEGVGQAMCSHTMTDMMSLATEAERMKAAGFVERSGMVVMAGLPLREMPLLSGAGVQLSDAEQLMVTGWSTPPSFDPKLGREADPPGRGRFLIKVGTRPGIPVRVALTDAEKGIHNTDKRWAKTTA
ncbi:ATP/GTP-binding protein [Micromonospora sp.]|uniref:ATP/GTP-binding protein n=1 Tax=Micromonospora sp. TaxID=1876 RepID=UPI003B3BDC8F